MRFALAATVVAMTGVDYVGVFDRAAPTYDRVGVSLAAPIADRLVAAARLRAGECVLDVGTGRGAVLAPAAAVVGPAGLAVGVDRAPTMVALTRAEFADLPQVRVLRADAAALPFTIAAFDAVLSSLVVFFTPDPAVTLRDWAALLAPGGRLGLATFIADPDDDVMRAVFRRWIPGAAAMSAEAEDSPTARVRDPRWLDAALAAAGVGEVTASTMRVAVRFDDVVQWERWALSTGVRAAIEAVPARDRAAFLADADAELRGRPLPDGSLGFHVSVRITVARRR